MLKPCTEKTEWYLRKNPDRVLIAIKGKKYLVPKNKSLGQFINVIHKHVKPKNVLVRNVIVSMDTNIEQLYNEHKETDGFLYLTIQKV